jgi:F420-dependent oxidoreductase-like protein
MGYIAAKTSRVEIASGILNIYSRTPALLAMTAAGLDYVSGGRFVLGIGASGPQVVEGFHGVRYDAPLGRSREVVEICRKIWRREPAAYDGRYYHLPLTAEHGGTGLGKPLKLINHPVRPNIPVVLAALGPKNVELAAELFDGWEPLFLQPERVRDAFGAALNAGRAKRPAELGELQIVADTQVSITESPEELQTAIQHVRNLIALYVGGMGARGRNFYNDLVVRYGYADDAKHIQDLYLDGKKMEAAAAVPLELGHGVSLIGSPDWVKERVEAYRKAGVTTLNAHPIGASPERCVRMVEQLKEFTA